jgi:tetratricopeptide (TPR) repeat protein
MRSTVPDEIRPFVDRAADLEKRERYDEAIMVLREGLAQFPDNAVLYNNLGCSLANIEQYDEAAEAFQRAVSLTPVNRSQGIVTPNTYPEEPMQNLRAVTALTQGDARRAPRPGRSGNRVHPSVQSKRVKRAQGRNGDPDISPPSVGPGMTFPQYVFVFLVANATGRMLAIIGAIVVVGSQIVVPSASALVLAIACATILAAAFLQYRNDPRLRG